MKKLLTVAAVLALAGGASLSAQAGPQEDMQAFQKFFKDRFPSVEFQEFGNGVYAIDASAREQWLAIEEFPPYELAIEEGKRLFETPFKNGKTYAGCFPDGGIGIAQKYPYFDTARNEVVTLELAVNECRQANGEEALPWSKGKLAAILSYMGYTSRGKTIDVTIPNDAAKAAYEDGKRFYYTRRGQLNMSCAHCHVDNAGRRIRADILSPALGHATHWPVYRADWGEVGTLHFRFEGCNKQVRAKAFKPQGKEYRNLEYFLSYMNNGLQMNGPASRK